MSEDEVAQRKLAALTRCYEQQADRTNGALKVLKSDVLHLRLEVGTLSTRMDSLETSVTEVRDALSERREEQQASNAQIIELLSNLVGRGPE